MSTSSPAVAQRAWWHRAKPEPSLPLSIPATISASSSTSSSYAPPLRSQRSLTALAPPAPSPKKGLGLKWLKAKRSTTDVALQMQDPPVARARPAAKSVSSTVRSSDPPEPRTPPDSARHSLLTLADDPFGRPDPARLSVASKRRAHPDDARVSYASASSGASFLSGPQSPQTMQSSGMSSPSWSV
jgi:hypothetical protein